MCLCLCGVKLSFFLVALPKKKGKRFHGNLITRMILVGKKIYSAATRNISESGKKGRDLHAKRHAESLYASRTTMAMPMISSAAANNISKNFKNFQGASAKRDGPSEQV